MKFYFDDYDLIASDEFNGKATLIDGDNKHGLVFFYNGSKLPIKIKLRKKYYIQIDDMVYPIEYRFIVQTPKFAIENKYDGPLGSFYHGDYTEFYVWAPTAFGVNVCFTDDTIYGMRYTENGVYYAKVRRDLEGIGYMLEVEHMAKYMALDPYARSGAINSLYNYVINPDKIVKRRKYLQIPKRDAIIYEANIRDFTTDTKCNFKYPGKFKGFIEKGIRSANNHLAGYDYIKNLGVTHVQLMPIYDFGSIDERDKSRQYNWGYDPVQYNVLEGKYSTDQNDPYERINELVKLVNRFNKDGIGVIMDVVFNHVYHMDEFSFEKLVPYYFFRYKDGVAGNASGCGNEVASERVMVRKFIVDSLVYLEETFGFSGFRFDLMGIHDIETMQLIDKTLREINPNIYLYGEGWKMNTVISSKKCAIQANHTEIPNIGFFNDEFRNKSKQLIIGQVTTNITRRATNLLTAPHYSNPLQSISYVSCHDNYTMFDELYYAFEESLEGILRQMKLAYTFILLGQGIPFLHGGCEGQRTKYGIENSYNSSEEINKIKYDDLNYELIDFVKNLISFRKSHRDYFFNTADEISEHVSIEVIDSMVHYKIKDLLIIINISDNANIPIFSVQEIN
ncbi:MAG: type I pullulanase [Candidatus Epulonipiscioides saccharophilum]|nr:MAG: type I pullulanase [Epulopiscium sp. AS2M-Bin001]